MADDRVKLAYFEQRVDSVMEDSQEVSVSRSAGNWWTDDSKNSPLGVAPN